jgi:hypothetical protein
MATNEIQGDVVGLWITTVLTGTVAADWKEVVCAENTGVDGSRDVNKKRTKCGVVKGYGPADWSINGTGANNSSPATGQVSSDDLAVYFQDGTDILVKVAHATTEALYYRQGQGQITKFNEGANTGDPLSFDFTIDISGDLTFTPPA